MKDLKPAPKKKPSGNGKRLLGLILTTVLLLLVYILAEVVCLFGQVVAYIVFWLYFAAALGILSAYLIYNRAFTLDKLEKEDLPDTWSEEEKTAFLEKRDQRKKKSRWMVTVLFGLAVTYFYEIFSLFFAESIGGFFASFGK